MTLQPKKLDWYIFKKFMLTFVIALVLIIGIVIVFDISEKIDKFVANQAPLRAIIVDYYMNFIPFFVNMYSAMFVFISVIFFTSRMAANSEIIAILSGGVSFHRMMVPYIVASSIIALVSLGLNLYVIPRSNQQRLLFEREFVKDKRTAVRDVHYQIAPGQFVYVESFSTWNNTAYRFTLESIEDNKIVSKLSAETAAWDSLSGAWNLKKYFIRDYTSGMSDQIRSGAQLDTVIALTVDDFYRNAQTVQTLPYNELQSLIKTQQMRGDSNIMYAQIEKHNRWAMPFSCIILTIIGVALSSRKKRGGLGWNLALGIAITFSYILFQRFAQMFVYTGIMPPGLAIWIPNFLFAIIAAFLYRVAPK
ncbi:MAG: LptF/LptG family permease [Bacteroidales bacterium]|jgi:Predicted permeases|nr:LptF/LptG family permease [Bacteroidales bacterium]